MRTEAIEPGTPKKDRDGLYKRRGYWHYALIIDGRKRSFTTETKDYNEAKKVRAQAVADKDKGKLPDDSGRKRFEATADEYMAHRKATVSAGSVKLEKERLKPLKKIIGNIRLKDITPRTIKSYQAARASEVGNVTVNLETRLLRAILKHEGQWKRLEDDYRRLPEDMGSPGRALTPEESERLFSVAASKDAWMVALEALTIAHDTGMRGVELRRLQLAGIDVDSRKITIRRGKGNNGRFRTVALTNDALKAVLALLDRAEKLNATKPEHYLFPYRGRFGSGYDPTKPTSKCWEKPWRELTKEAGLLGFRFHDLRHTFITAHAEANTPLPVVQAMAGQLTKKMTELYTHISTRALEEAQAVYEKRKHERLAEAKKKLQVEAKEQAVN